MSGLQKHEPWGEFVLQNFNLFQTGTMIYNKRAYEIHPGSSILGSMSDILQERGLGSDPEHSVHVLRKINLHDYLRSHDGKRGFTLPNQG